ncbi:MAG: carbon starvation protein A [Deltaproteobacteria bacterium]|nr:carbon starvation protein A [Deltaproteobacteria bacterium]
MNVLAFLIPAILFYGFGYFVYSRWIERKWGMDPSRATPATTMADGRDYVPTKPHVLFAHHFATIAGAGPIVGPATALIYGALPAWLWVVLGGVFIGAVHDFATLFSSIRNRGRSMAEIAREHLGTSAFILFILFLILLIVVVNAVFLQLTAKSLTSLWPIVKLSLPESQTVFNAVEVHGVLNARIGGIASTSVILLTFAAPFLGIAIYKKGLPMRWAYPIGTVVACISILAGFYHPVTLDAETWQKVFSVYVFIAAGVPVWVILQPRDFMNVQILYGGLLLLVLALFAAGLQGVGINAPLENIRTGSHTPLGSLWPGLFITIACGAISGFHGIVASGVTSKQITNERYARKVGYLAMLGESTLGLCVMLAISAGIVYSDYLQAVWPENPQDSNPVLGFALGAAGIFEKGFGIPMWLGVVFGILLVEGFVITTLDTSVRLNRYLFEELWRASFREKIPRPLMNPWFNGGLAVLCMWVVAKSGVWVKIWALFGSANQLLGALSLLVVTLWLRVIRRPTLYTLVPCVALCVTTLWSLVRLLPRYIADQLWTLATFDAFLLLLSLSLILISFTRAFFKRARRP